MRTRHRTFSFTGGDAGGVISEMIQFADGADGRRWVNIVPDVDEREIPTGSAMWRVFSARGPVIPQVTWYPAHEHRGRLEPAQVGVAHATGKDALGRLAAGGVTTPPGWTPIQDHPKRGVIYLLDTEVDPAQVIEHAMGAIRRLSPFLFEDAYLITFSEQ